MSAHLSVPGLSLRPVSGEQLLDEASRDELLAMCRQAAAAARQRKLPVLVSWAAPLPHVDPAALWSRARESADRSLYWQSGWDRSSLVAIGAAHDLTGHGEDRIRSVAASWEELVQEPVAGGSGIGLPTGQGPVLVGGFSFAPSTTPGATALPDALMWVPALQVRSSATVPGTTGTTAPDELRLNAVMFPGGEPEQIAKDLVHLAELCLLPESAAPRADGVWRQQHGSLLDRQELPSPERWKDLVGRAVGRIRNGAFEKVVLARELRVTADGPFDVPAAVESMRSTYPDATVFAVEHDRHAFVGATPEYLVRLTDGTAHALGLAGTAPRGATAQVDAELEAQLRNSAKIRHEHDVVVRMLRDALHPTCAHVEASPEPTVLKLANVQHLATVVEGRGVQPDLGILQFVERLHPTPALGGYPREQSLDWLAHNEGLERGWYAGTIGWTDGSGQGEFAVAIRCALIHDNIASLYAGCGIVADSDPEEEYAETCAKLLPMLHALGIE
ncbi:isochorismate synthase [Streptomyces roseifaciens]|uniref:isochorismate synthase n=1 Tax=Streptomyces roseifaciens TaxID=1488406 RepID=UPI000717EEF4|nr:isochorismate synthase [Streptomyces roseifaciens]